MLDLHGAGEVFSECPVSLALVCVLKVSARFAFHPPTLPVGPAELRSRPSHRCLGPFSKPPDLCWGQASERLAERTVLPSAALQVSCAESRHAQSLSASCSHAQPWGCFGYAGICSWRVDAFKGLAEFFTSTCAVSYAEGSHPGSQSAGCI